MKTKRFCCAILLACLALVSTGCGKQRFDPALVAEHYGTGAPDAEYTVTTHAGFYTEYRLSCAGQEVTILQPESVAGITAVLAESTASLQYRDVSLDALLPEREGYAPMDALHVILKDLKGEVPTAYTVEKEALFLEYQTIFSDGTEAVKQLVLHPETLALQGAELYLDGSLVLSLKMDRFDWRRG